MRRYAGGMPLLTGSSLTMRTDTLALIRGATEFVTTIYGPAVTFAFPGAILEVYRKLVLQLNLISAVAGSISAVTGRGLFMITELHQEGRFYRLSTGRAAHFENMMPHNPSTEDWCILEYMEEGNYLMMDPACELNEKITMEYKDGN